MHTGADPFGFVPKLERISLVYTRDLIYLIQFGSAIRSRLDGIKWPYQFGTDPFRSRGDARIRSRTGADAKRGLFSLLNKGFPVRGRKPLSHPHYFGLSLLWIGSILVESTRNLYGSDLNEIRSKMDPLPRARSLRQFVLRTN